MKRICYLADASSTHTKKFCDYFHKKGYEIHVISLNKGNIENSFVYSLDFDVDKIKNKSAISKIGYLTAFFKVKKLVKEIKPDILHAHFASSYGLLGSLLNYKPYILSVWGTDIYEFPKNSMMQKKIINYNLKKADVILSTSKDMARETSLYTSKDIHITPFGVDVEIFKPLNKKKYSNNKIIIGTIKNLEERYGIEYLIKAFKKVKDELPNINMGLVIGGEGSKKSRLIELTKDLGIEKDVEFIGYVNQSDIVDIFNKFDIAVFPSLKESFGVAAVEAQACSVPVIATNVGGLPEAIKEGESAILVPPKDDEALKEAILDLIKNEEKRIKMGICGRSFVCENLNIDKNFDKIDKIYKEILK